MADQAGPSNDVAVEQLVSARERFLSFVKTRVSDAQAAEDILQSSLAKAIEGLPSLRNQDRVVPWFYSVLRNSITDWYRLSAQNRNTSLPDDLDIEDEPEERERQLCRCFESLLPGLQPQYAELIELLDLEGESSADVSIRLGITAGNLKVRHHRARQALRRALEDTCRVCAVHHCMDCTCGVGGSSRETHPAL